MVGNQSAFANIPREAIFHPTCYKIFCAFQSGRADFDSTIRRFASSRPNEEQLVFTNFRYDLLSKLAAKERVAL
jgi:hypothetical protein